MKTATNIAHKKPNTNEWCEFKLCKEPWGMCSYEMEWHLTCMVCGFTKMVSNDTFLKWQYCDKVLYE